MNVSSPVFCTCFFLTLILLLILPHFVRFSNTGSTSSEISSETVRESSIINKHISSDSIKLNSSFRYARSISCHQIENILHALHQAQSNISHDWDVVNYPIFFNLFQIPKLSWEIQRSKFIEMILESKTLRHHNPFVIAFSGSSVTAGHDNYFNEAYPQVFYEDVEPVWKAMSIPLEVRNQAIGNNPCYPYDACIETHLGSDPDIITWEQSMNCGRNLKPVDTFLRMASKLPKKPTVIFMQSGTPNWKPEECDAILLQANHTQSSPSVDGTAFSRMKDHSTIRDIVQQQNELIFDNMRFLQINPRAIKLDILWENQTICKPYLSYRSLVDMFAGLAPMGQTVLPIEEYKCKGPYHRNFSVKSIGNGGADWHPGKLGHKLRGDNLAYFLLEILKEAVEVISDVQGCKRTAGHGKLRRGMKQHRVTNYLESNNVTTRQLRNTLTNDTANTSTTATATSTSGATATIAEIATRGRTATATMREVTSSSNQSTHLNHFIQEIFIRMNLASIQYNAVFQLPHHMNPIHPHPSNLSTSLYSENLAHEVIQSLLHHDELCLSVSFLQELSFPFTNTTSKRCSEHSDLHNTSSLTLLDLSAIVLHYETSFILERLQSQSLDYLPPVIAPFQINETNHLPTCYTDFEPSVISPQMNRTLTKHLVYQHQWSRDISFFDQRAVLRSIQNGYGYLDRKYIYTSHAPLATIIFEVEIPPRYSMDTSGYPIWVCECQKGFLKYPDGMGDLIDSVDVFLYPHPTATYPMRDDKNRTVSEFIHKIHEFYQKSLTRPILKPVGLQSFSDQCYRTNVTLSSIGTYLVALVQSSNRSANVAYIMTW